LANKGLSAAHREFPSRPSSRTPPTPTQAAIAPHTTPHNESLRIPTGLPTFQNGDDIPNHKHLAKNRTTTMHATAAKDATSDLLLNTKHAKEE
jgi:hypothetical protein